jgi:hypothetical protein
MQLLKRRNFSDQFSDTFTFIKLNGKHYFKNYFIINGIPILLMLLFIYFFVSSFYNLSTFGTGNSPAVIEDFMTKNMGLFVVIVVVTVIVAFIFAIIQYSYTPIYLLLYRDHNGINFTAKDVYNKIFKEKLGKILVFFLVSLLFLIPVAIFSIIAGIILLITIVGIFFLFAAIAMFYNNALIEYLDSDKGIFDSFSYSVELIKINFWANTGAIGLFLFITGILNGGISLVTTLLTSLISVNTIDASEQSIIAMVSLVASFVLSKGISIFLQIINQLAVNIVYFSAKEEKENIIGKTEIEKIGLGE